MPLNKNYTPVIFIPMLMVRRKKNIVVSGNMDKKNRVGRSFFFFFLKWCF